MRLARARFEGWIQLLTAAVLVWSSFGVSAESFKAKVVDVSAGDIFKVRHAGQRELVVLYGVEAPSSGTLAGKRAKRFATEAVLKKQVEVRVVERKEGLTLVELKLENGTNLGHLMLRKGLVRWDSFTAPDDQGLQELEQLAKAGNRGLWYPRLRPTEAPSEVPEIELAGERVLVDNPSRGAGYRVLEGRVVTDEAGVKTLFLRGNGEKQIGFEAAVVRRRMDAHLAYLAEMERLERERLRREREAARLAAEKAERSRQQWLQYETERMLRESRALNADRGARLRYWTMETGWQ